MRSVSGWRLELTDPMWLWGLAALLLLALWSRRSLVRASKTRGSLGLACRAAMLIALVLALAGLTLRRPWSEPFVVFAIDRSLSVGEEGTASAEEFLDRALVGPSREHSAFLGFAGGPGPVGPDRAVAISGPIREEARMGTDLAGAIRAAVGAVPPGFSPRIVVLTDGNATTGDALAAARATGAPVWTVPLAPGSEPQVQLSAVEVPARVREGEPFEVEIVIASNHDDEANLKVFDSNGPIDLPGGSRITVRKGETRVRFTYRVNDQSLARIQAQVSAFRDTRVDDNSARGLVRCRSRPRILLVDSEPSQAEHLAEALAQEGLQVDLPRPPEGLPESLAELQSYDLVILSNVPATHPKLDRHRFQLLRRYVQDLGGGLLIIGGDRSFGPGGYARSPIEELLPVYCDFRKEQEKATLGMMLVLDKSGSMAGRKMEIVKEAARGAIDLLNRKDFAGIISFDTRPYRTSPARVCAEKDRIVEGLSRVDAEGGTSILPAMTMAGEELIHLGSGAKFKHMIVISDGADNEKGVDDFRLLLQRLVASRITVSCVAVGRDADLGFLRDVARLGGGRYYAAEDLATVPQIFAQETIQASKDALLEESFSPQQFRRSPVLQGIDWTQAPVLNGYVVTRIKPTSEQILITDRADPLLAWWRTGLGMCGAFTSDAHAHWAEPWVSGWPGGFSKFWSQVCRHLMRKEVDGLDLRLDRKGERCSVVLDATDDDGGFLNDVPTTLTVLDPQRAEISRSMLQTAPGRYETAFDSPLGGEYWLVVSQTPNDRPPAHVTHGMAVGYHEELRLKPLDEAGLKALAETSGGRFDPAPEAVFEPAAGVAWRDIPLRNYLIALAAFLAVAGIALRRLDVGAIPARTRRPARRQEVAVGNNRT